MRASKYPLERWRSPIPDWYSTPSQISDETISDLNGAVVGLSIAIFYGAS
jgi:hypothetical protein